MYVAVQSVRLSLLSGCNRTSVSSTDFSKNITNTKFYKNPPNVSRVVSWVRTDGQWSLYSLLTRLFHTCCVVQVSVEHWPLRWSAVSSSVVNRALNCSHVTDWLTGWLTRRRMAAYTSFLVSAVDRGECSASRPGRLTVGERTPSIY
jgi:hypothetical protein